MSDLLSELKRKQKITWDDEDESLLETIKRGKAKINKIVGVEVDFDDENNKSLLFNYCRYSRNNVSEYFEENFSSDLLRLQLEMAVNSNEET